MRRQGRRYCWWLVATVLLCGVAVVTWFGWRWLAPKPGSSEDVFSRIRVGMSQNEAVAILRTYDDSYNDGVYSWGVTKDGRSLDRMHVGSPLFHDLPPPQEIEHCVLEVDDAGEDGQEVKIILGRGGIVTGKQLSPGVWEKRQNKIRRALFSPDEWEYRLHKVQRELFTLKVWKGRLRKFRRVLRHREDYVAMFLGAGLLLGSAWTARRWMARRKRTKIS